MVATCVQGDPPVGLSTDTPPYADAGICEMDYQMLLLRGVGIFRGAKWAMV